jgi:DNA-binding winged helix-turn-helix (wHTH) protein/TolB-like protein
MPAPGRLRFGIFEFDPDTRELRREGLPVRLQAQPAQVLAMLLSHADAVVTRETLRQAVWGTDTFVDFDRGLNFCVAQIRSALGDSAESPRFVRTLPKRGYQFIAPVTALDEDGPAAPRRNWRPAAAALVLAAALLLVGRLWLASQSTVRVAVTRFDNETGDPALDRFADGLTDAVVADLTTSGAGRYGVIGNAAILRLPRARRDLLAIGSSLGADYVVLGQIQGDPAHPRILAHLIRLPAQTHLWVTRRDDLSIADPARAQSETARLIAAEFARRLNSPGRLPH